jgi:hypothetical protein
MRKLQMSWEMKTDEGFQWDEDAVIMKGQEKHPIIYVAKIHKMYFLSVSLNMSNSPYRNVNFK